MLTMGERVLDGRFRVLEMRVWRRRGRGRMEPRRMVGDGVCEG